jgi:hypothetical protein
MPLLILDRQMRDAGAAIDRAKKRVAVAIAQEQQEGQRRGHVLQQRMRLAQLERGRRIARAAEEVRIARRGRIEAAPIFEGTLAEAEATLARLREHHVEADVAEAAYDSLDAATRPITVAEKLAEQGFGPRLKPDAADVLARMVWKRRGPASPISKRGPLPRSKEDERTSRPRLPRRSRALRPSAMLR